MNKTTNAIYNIKANGLECQTTANHPFYIRYMIRNKEWGDRFFTQPQFIKIKDIQQTKYSEKICNSKKKILQQPYIAIPIIKEQRLFEYNGITKHYDNIYKYRDCFRHIKCIKTCEKIDITNKSFWWLLGLYVADGWYRERQKSGNSIIICSAKDIKEKEMITNKITESGFNCYFVEEKDVYKYHISSNELCEFVKMFGKYATNKTIPMKVIELPNDLLESFFNGYLFGDGSFYKNKYSFSTSSKELLLSMQLIVAKLYRTSGSLTKRIPPKTILGRKVNTHINYQYAFFKEKHRQMHYYNDGDFIWCPIRNIEEIQQQEIVYNLSVEEDETYIADNIVVHNCSTFSMSGLREKSWGVEKIFHEGQKKQRLDDLFFEAIELVNQLRPKVATFENVEGLIKGNAKIYFNKIIADLTKIGYITQAFIVDGSTLGLPQRRRRLFFIAQRQDFFKKKLQLNFNEEPIQFYKIRDNACKEYTNISHAVFQLYFKKRKDDVSLSCICNRSKNKKSWFNYKIIKNEDILPTFCTQANSSFLLADQCRCINKHELLLGGSFPQDYNFLNGKLSKVSWLIGMSVPPLMMYKISKEIEKQLFV
jgi:DNA (cytosine-5)-methyltransferase 1